MFFKKKLIQTNKNMKLNSTNTENKKREYWMKNKNKLKILNKKEERHNRI